MKDYTEEIKSVIFGHAVADALGVPAEFNKRETLDKAPFTDMVGYGTYPYPEGFSLPAEEDFFPEEEDFIPEEPEYEDNLFWNDSEWSEETTTEDTVVSDDNYTGGSL